MQRLYFLFLSVKNVKSSSGLVLETFGFWQKYQNPRTDHKNSVLVLLLCDKLAPVIKYLQVLHHGHIVCRNLYFPADVFAEWRVVVVRLLMSCAAEQCRDRDALL